METQRQRYTAYPHPHVSISLFCALFYHDADYSLCPVFLESSLCADEFGAVYRCVNEAWGFFQTGGIECHYDHPLRLSVPVNRKQDREIRQNSAFLFFDELMY